MKRTHSKLRRQIAAEAGRLLHERRVTDYRSARQKAVEKLALHARITADDFPTDREIRRQIRAQTLRDQGGSLHGQSELRLAALRVMRALRRFQSRVSFDKSDDEGDIDNSFVLRVYGNEVEPVIALLKSRAGAEPLSTEAMTTWKLCPGEITFSVIMLSRSELDRFSTQRGWFSAAEIEMLMAVDDQDLDLSGVEIEGPDTDRYVLWGMLLSKLEEVHQDPIEHPEGDALYHSLQAFELARQQFEYDVEMVTACLLHDVGKGIDPRDHVAAGLAALAGSLSPREEFLIAHHMEALEYQNGTLAQKLKLKLKSSEWFDDLMALRAIDNQARQRGVPVCTIEEALDFIESHEVNYE